jgi:hypothetical protein
VNVDFSLAKSFDIAERKTLQFRVEVFDSPNHPNFAVPSQKTAFTSPTGVPSLGIISPTTTRPRQFSLD